MPGYDYVRHSHFAYVASSDNGKTWTRPQHLLGNPQQPACWNALYGLKDGTILALSNYQDRISANAGRSRSIAGLSISPDRQSIGNGDNWPITWADDDAQFTVYCDGKGFGGDGGDRSMSLATITGSPPNVHGKNIASPSGQKTGGGQGRT